MSAHCGVAPMLEITVLAKSGGPLTKRISLDTDGTLRSDGSACTMASGVAQRATFNSLAAFAACIGRLAPHEAIALGALRDDLPDQVRIVTKAELNGHDAPDLIARTGSHILYRPDQPALVLIDIDTKGMPDPVRRRIDAYGGFWAALVSVMPELETAARVVRKSTSAGLSRVDTGERLPGSNGRHVFVVLTDGGDAERFLRCLHARCWLHGFGWLMVGAAGQRLERSLVDRMVYAPERLVFEGPPILDAPLAQDRVSRMPDVTAGAPLDTRAVCPDLSIVEQAQLTTMLRAAANQVAPQAAVARAAFIASQAATIATRTGLPEPQARRIAEQQCHGVLLPDIVLPFDDEVLRGATVADVLADPARFEGATLADPMEGPDYGRCKAKVMRRADGVVWVHSFAHGRTTYELKHDARSIEVAIQKASPTEAADLFVALLLTGAVEPDEEQRLRDIVCKHSGTKARPLAAKIKAARAEHDKRQAGTERERQAAQSSDRRLRIDAPAPDAERLPILSALDEVLAAIEGAEPPVRDAEGRPAEARCRPPILLHEMLTTEANTGESE